VIDSENLYIGQYDSSLRSIVYYADCTRKQKLKKKKFTQMQKHTKTEKTDISFLPNILMGGREVISYWFVVFTMLVIPDIIAIIWNRSRPLVFIAVDYLLFLQEQIKDIIILCVWAQTSSGRQIASTRGQCSRELPPL